MTAIEKAKLAMVIEANLRQAMREVLDEAVATPLERDEVASAVVALLLKRIYIERDRPVAWLQKTLEMVMNG